MKYLKLFESQNIEDICNQYHIWNWTLNSDGTVDVDGYVDLDNKSLQKIPLKFGNVSGYFSCERNKLKNLIGCPKRVDKNFSCNSNNLTSLEGAPAYIGRDFWCLFNENLWSMDHFPRHAKRVHLEFTPILHIFNLFRSVYIADGGEFFSTSGTLMDFFQDCDPVYPNKIIKKRRMNNFLASIDKELKTGDISNMERVVGWKIED